MFESFKPFRRGAVANWEYVHLKEGQRWQGFMAGPVIGVPTHFEGGTVGCRRALTRGALKCTCEVKELETRWRGYVPLWDVDAVRWVVIIGERFGEIAMRLKHMDQVRVSKTTGRGSPLRVDEHAFTTKLPPLNKAERLPQDLRRWMARVWADEELEQWFRENPQSGSDPEKPIPFTVADRHFEERVEDIANRLTLKPNAKDAELPALVNRVLNGVHKKAKKN